MSDNTGTSGQGSLRVAIVGGDGIGPEVVEQGLRVIDAAGVTLETESYDLGGARYLKDGTVLPDSVLEEWRGFDAIYLGAVGTPGVPPGVIERGLIVAALDRHVPSEGRALKPHPARNAARSPLPADQR